MRQDVERQLRDAGLERRRHRRVLCRRGRPIPAVGRGRPARAGGRQESRHRPFKVERDPGGRHAPERRLRPRAAAGPRRRRRQPRPVRTWTPSWRPRGWTAGSTRPRARSVEAHLADCHDCQALLATLARTSTRRGELQAEGLALVAPAARRLARAGDRGRGGRARHLGGGAAAARRRPRHRRTSQTRDGQRTAAAPADARRTFRCRTGGAISGASGSGCGAPFAQPGPEQKAAGAVSTRRAPRHRARRSATGCGRPAVAVADSRATVRRRGSGATGVANESIASQAPQPGRRRAARRRRSAVDRRRRRPPAPSSRAPGSRSARAVELLRDERPASRRARAGCRR